MCGFLRASVNACVMYFARVARGNAYGPVAK